MEGVINFIVENFDREDIVSDCFLEEFRKVIVGGFNIPNGNLHEIRGSSGINHIAHYSLYRSEIVFNFNRLVNILNDLRRKRIFKSIDEEHMRYMFFKILLHEVGHAYESSFLVFDKKLRFYRDSDEVLLGDVHLSNNDISFIDILISNYLYLKYHNYFPTERHAEMFSFMVMNKVIDSLDLKNISDYKVYSLHKITEGYSYKNSSVSPLKKFYSIIKRRDIYDELNLDEINTKGKFIYGAELNNDELSMEVSNVLGNIDNIDAPKKLQKYLI